MDALTVDKFEAAFLTFFKTAHRAIDIETEKDYEFALEVLEHLMTKAEDNEGEPLLHMIDIIADSIEKYESSLDSVKNFVEEVEDMNPGVSMLRLLISQHGMSYADLESEIGSKSLVSQILNGSKNLTKTHIANLSKRFNISPALFF